MVIKLASELVFLSQIKRDGSGTIDVDNAYIDIMIKQGSKFKIFALSLTQKTYIAIGFNSFVVKLK